MKAGREHVVNTIVFAGLVVISNSQALVVGCIFIEFVLVGLGGFLRQGFVRVRDGGTSDAWNEHRCLGIELETFPTGVYAFCAVGSLVRSVALCLEGSGAGRAGPGT